MIAIARRIVPDVITLVPERREERTTEGGLDVIGAREQIAKVAAMCRDAGIKLSLFIAPDFEQIAASRAVGAEQIELHTGEYCHLTGAAQLAELSRLTSGALRAVELGLEVAAGHGLTRHNVVDVAAIEPIVELNIGHAVIADALFGGLPAAVRDFRAAIERGVGERRT